MKNHKQLLAFLLALVMVVSMLPAASAAHEFKRVNANSGKTFPDIAQEDWFFPNVKDAFELGLMKGQANGSFNPSGNITLAETITVAARIHAIATNGTEAFVQGNPWYKVYADYALANGIIAKEPEDYAKPATRIEFAEILALALSADDLSAINTVEDGAIPDVKENAAVYKLYRAGVLGGNDESGTFLPESNIKRSEVSAIVARMALPGTRLKKDIKHAAKEEEKQNKEEAKQDKEENKQNNAGGIGNGIAGIPNSSNRPKPNRNKVSVSAKVETDENGNVKDEVSMSGEQVSATVPAGVALEDGADKLTLTVAPMKETGGNIETSENEELKSLDIHINGVSEENTVAILVTLGEILPVGMNLGNITLYHIENDETNAMTQVMSLDELDAHNEFYYDPATGIVTVALATFSEVAVVSDTTQAWEGNFDYTWYTNAVAPADGEAVTEYIIANADQLAAFGAIVGGMAKDENGNFIYTATDEDGKEYHSDSFTGKTVKLIADVNLADAEANNNSDIIFYPIGYYNNTGSYEKESGGSVTSSVSSFEGTFDGNGHTIKNFYQNTWEMFGDYNSGYSGTPNHYNDAKGLFGYVYNGTIKNLTVDNFSSDGEFTPTGVIAAYACNSTFENIAITNCNPRVYNTGNGGIVGIGGNSNDPDTYKLTFTNITIDNTNKITALWGSWDVACGGLVGMFRGAGHVNMTNCHVAAQMDVYNDVCGNYQYYWYRYSGMMVGTNKNMITDDDGYTVPETSKYHAENCTVHFGNWNDYYYCELVANSLASYTHDHQFSRLEQVDSVDVENKTVTVGDKTTAIPTSGRYNYVVVNGDPATENATCYHFVNGEVWNHADAGTETVNGETILKEDRQHYYLPFNQLFTGYGWGVKHIPIYDDETPNPFSGVTVLDRVEAGSEVKFDSLNNTNLFNTKEYKLSELFAAAKLKDDKLSIKSENVQVTVSPVGKESTVTGKYVADTFDWINGKLTLSGTGNATITIQDYYFCIPTTITVNVTEREAEEKFDIVMNNGDFLHRVGNSGTVALDKLFKAKDGVTVGTVSVTVEAVDGTEASGTYSNNAIQFSGTGVVKVTITDNDYCKPTELYLEVVDATNVTSATGTTSGGNFVLLCDVNTTTYVNYWNCTLYGNGFTYSLNGAPTAYNSKQGHGILITKNATLDNLVIVGDVYDEYGAYTTQDYYNAAVDVVGDTTIQNCYISGCAAPVSTRANATIVNSTLYGGTVGNLIIKSGTVTLEDVTTANYDDGRSLVGMGIVIHSDATESAKLVLNGTLTQYNFISESKVPTDTYAKNLHSTMFGDSCSKYHFGTSPNRYVNAGIVSLTALFNAEDITDNANTGYVGNAVTLSGVSGYVYTQPNTSGSVNNNFPEYVATTQGAVPPSYSFDYTNKNYVAKTDGSNDYCYEENGTVYISMDEGDTFNWDTLILTLGKNITAYTVSMNGTDYTGKSITFDTADDYEVVYTYTDDNNFKLDENGNIVSYSVTYTKTVNITVAVVEAATKHAEFTFGSSNTASTTVTIGNKTYVMPNVSATSSTIGSTTVDGKTIYYPIVEIVMSDDKTSHKSGWYAYFPVFSGAVTITDYKDNGLGDAETFGSSTQSMPSGLSIVGDPAQLFKYQSSSTAGTSPVVKNNILVYSSPSISANRSEYNTVIQYSYQDNAGATYYYYIGYHAPAQSYSSCFTPDTLITLADGSQKRIDEVTYEDKILTWDFFKGEYTEQNIILLINHGEDLYKVANSVFSDGTVLRTIAEHGIFDYDLNKFVYITPENAEEYIGHRFFKANANGGYDVVTLDDAYVTEEYTTAYSITSSYDSNAFAEGMLTLAPPDGFYNWIEMGDTLTYDVEKFNADVEKYGLYTYEDFADYVTYEQFIAFNGAYLKIPVEKGLFTFDYILELIDLYLS
ncbi:MAG: S-layer homology domain-containing protein [Oscillospiraceae bacterium]|nr:S-layer homology domain-containing protein [Oscillospiraceae bacterium]